MSSTNNVKKCHIVQQSVSELAAFQANLFSKFANILKQCNTKVSSKTCQSTNENIFKKFENISLPPLKYNQFACEWYYFPSLMRYLDYWNIGYVATVSGSWYILTVDYHEMDFALHYYLVVKGKKEVQS